MGCRCRDIELLKDKRSTFSNVVAKCNGYTTYKNSCVCELGDIMENASTATDSVMLKQDVRTLPKMVQKTDLSHNRLAKALQQGIDKMDATLSRWRTEDRQHHEEERRKEEEAKAAQAQAQAQAQLRNGMK